MGWAQSESALDAFTAQVRAGSSSFQDRRAAVAAGYRRIGPDFPGMAEHWVNIPLLMRDSPDPSAPPILSYARIDGEPTLVGVAFAVAVEPGVSPPPPLAGCGSWHFHAGSVDDESFLPTPRMSDPATGVRLAVVHAWVWLENPTGLCARDNWALPYVRAGIPPPQKPDPDAARAVALVAGARPFYRARWQRLRPDRSVEELDRLLDSASEAIVAELAERRQPEVRDRRLAELWRTLCIKARDRCDGKSAESSRQDG